MPRPPVALHLRLAFLLQLFGMQTLVLLDHMFLIHFPALPYGSKTAGDFFVVQPLRRGAQAFGQAGV